MDPSSSRRPHAQLVTSGSGTSEVPLIRQQVVSTLVGWGFPDAADEGGLAVSELMANALLHAGPPVTVALQDLGTVVRLEVTDTSPAPPTPVAAETIDTVGRGMTIIAAVCERWGWFHRGRGKVVWCDLATQATSGASEAMPPLVDERDDQQGQGDLSTTLSTTAARVAAVSTGGTPQGRTVRVHDVPADVFRAQMQHAEGQLREMRLAHSTSADHAAAGAAAAYSHGLHAQLHAQALGTRPPDPGSNGERREVTVTISAPTEGAEYLQLLDEIDVECRAGRLLSLPSPAIHRSFRRWLIGEIEAALRRQSGDAGAPVRSWETALAQEVERLTAGRTLVERVLEAAPDAMIGVDGAGIIRLVNRQTEVMFGYERHELIGRAIECLVPDGSRALHPSHRHRYAMRPVNRPMGVGLDLRGRRRDGSEFPVDISLSSLETEEGVLTTAAVRDVTERARFEAMFEGLLEGAPDAIVAVNRQGVIRLVNRQTELLFGYGRADLVGQRLEILIPLVARGVHPSHRAAYFADPRTRPMGAGLELSGRHKDGNEFPVDISLSSLETAEGRLVIASVRDLTSTRRIRESLRETHRIAEILQRSMLGTVPPIIGKLSVAARYRPAQSGATVGGDWHDVFALDGHIGVTVGDVGGHGIEAAAVMGRLRTTLAAVAPDEPDPGIVLSKVNRALCGMAPPPGSPAGPGPDASSAWQPEGTNLLATAIYGRLDLAATQFTYAVAGQPGPVIIDSTTATARLDDPPENLLLGVEPSTTFAHRHITLPPAGRLLLFTDGLYERRTSDVSVSLQALVTRASSLATSHVSDIADELMTAIEPQPSHWSDDLALVVLGW